METPTTVSLDGEVIEATWKPPAAITPDLRMAAADMLESQNRLCQPADPDSVRRWLLGLGNLTASKDGEQSAADAIKLYIATLEERRYPVGTFTKGSLNRAAAQWEWFPKYAPLVAFLDKEAAKVRERRSRLAQIAGGQSPAEARQKAEEDLSAEEYIAQRHKVADFFGQLWRGIAAAKDGDDTLLEGMAQQYGGAVRTKEGA